MPDIYLENTPLLAGHNGTQPDLLLRWNNLPDTAEAIDVIVHLHGFSHHGGAMPLSKKVGPAGLDLSGRTRPTLAVLPRGNWIRYNWYDFPALLDGGLDRLIEYALWQMPRPLAMARLILTAHSGGVMPAVDAIATAAAAPDELHLFDGLYGRHPSLGGPMHGIDVIETWLKARLAVETQRPGALRIIYIEQQTGAYSRRVGELIAQQIAATGLGLVPELARRYRVERSHVPHSHIGAVCGPQLLAQAEAVIDWTRLPAFAG